MTQKDERDADGDRLAFLAGGSEMAERTRAFDWSQTPLGPVEGWSRSLKTVVRVMLDSRYAMWIGWGPDFTFFYNDAYARMTLGPKHPWALGRSAREVWSEIWDDIGSRADSVVRTGQATYDEGMLLFLERQGFPEETYHTFSYSPVPDDLGGVGGMLCVVTEDTERTVGERRLRTLRELAAGTTIELKSAEVACQTAVQIFAGNPHDLPFVLLYLIESDGRQAKLTGRAGLDPDLSISPGVVDLEDEEVTPWPFRQVIESGRGIVVHDLPAQFGPLPVGVWPESPQQAIVLPITKPGQGQPAGFVVAGISPCRPFDDGYRGFLDLLTGQIANAVANARAYEEERRRAEKLAELDRTKTAFFSNVSHEFRTPLTLLLGPVETILSQPDRIHPEDRQSLDLVYRNALRLQKLVNTLLDFSRIEAGRVEASYEPTDLSALTAELASNFRSACESSGLALRVDCPPLPEPVYVDRSMWEKVVLNLVSNAFKFTLQGRIEVSLHAAGDHAELVVRDTGTGIPAEEMPRIFERFHRVEGSKGRTLEGSGIGLALVRELVGLQGGAVRAESVPGQGSAFTVTIPFGSAHLPSDRLGTTQAVASAIPEAAPFIEEAHRWRTNDIQATSKVSTPSLFPRREYLLLADDNADMREYVRRLLAERYEVSVVSDGLSALESARARTPDLILSDVMMPVLDGFGLLRELRSDPRTREIPVLLLSARAGEEARVEGLEAGANDYITKPFNARELLARVGSQIDLARLRHAAEQERRRGDERSRAILESITDAFFSLDRSWRFIYVNRQAERILDRQPGDLLGKRLWEEFPGLIGNEFEAAYRHAMDDDAATSVTSYYPDHDRWYEVHSYPSPEGLSIYFRDVSARKRAEERERLLLKDAATANAQFRAFFEQGALFAGIMSVDGILLETNRLALEGCGFTREEVIGKPFWETPWWSPSATLARQIKNASEQAASGQTYRAEMPYFVADGSERMVDFILMPIKNAEGQVMFLAPTGTDITDRKRAEEERHKFVSLAENSTDFIGIFDLEHIALYLNRAGLTMLGLDAVDRACGMPVREFFFAEDQPTIMDEFFPTVLEQGHGEIEVRFRHVQTGEPVWVMCHVFALTDPEGRRIGFATVSRDITQRRQLEDNLRRLATDLSEADRRKDEFLATLAHELRNPLAPIRNGLEIMRMAGDDRHAIDESRELMERQVTHMVRLIDDLMDVSRIARDKLELRKERVELAAVVQSAVDTSRPLVEASNHELSVTLPARPLYLDADMTRLAQVFSNLLNNAAKYTEPGGDIALAAERQGSDVVVTVRDNGVGIPPEMLPRVFELFTQVDASLERAQGGLGIGLTLVKRLVEMHDGSVEARSVGKGQGSEFVVRLPIVVASPARPQSTEGSSKSAEAVAGRRILVVDDNQDSARTLVRLLKMMGHETRMAHDGGEAVAMAEAYRPDAILLDIGLPVLNGYDVARTIRARPWGQAVTIVALTGWGQEGDRRRSKEAGIDRHLVKPVDPIDLEAFLTGLRPGTNVSSVESSH